MTCRKQSGVAFWVTAVVVVAPLLYVLSQGPAFFLCSQFERDTVGHRRAWGTYLVVYWPLSHVREWCAPFGDFQRAYLTVWNPRSWQAENQRGVARGVK